jgi:hypothetical protein
MQGSQRGRATNHGQGTYTFKPLYCMYHGSETNHCTKDCPIFLESKTKMEQDPAQPSQQSTPRKVNHTMQWALHHQQYSPSYPSLPPQAYQNQPLAYYQSYHYFTTNHSDPSPVLQITYPPPVLEITYPMPNNTNPHVKTEANPPPPPQIQEPSQQVDNFPTHGTILTITGGSNTDFDIKR